MATVEERFLLFSKSEDVVKEASYVYVMENMDNYYDNFAEMLYGETEDRWILQHYLALKLNVSDNKKKESAMWELGWFLDKAIDCQELFAEHAKDAGKFLKYIYPEDKEI